MRSPLTFSIVTSPPIVCTDPSSVESVTLIWPLFAISAAFPARIRTPVDPSAAFSIRMRPPLAIVRPWLELIVTAVPDVSRITPPFASWIAEGAPLFAVAVAIGVVRSLLITTWAVAPEAIINGASATAAASLIRM